jgi:hypothetical protein
MVVKEKKMTPEERSEYGKKYYQANKEKILKQSKIRKKQNKNKNKEANSIAYRKYYEENKELILLRKKQRLATQKEKIAERDRLYHQANKERMEKYYKEYYLKNRDKVAEKRKKRILQHGRKYTTNSKIKHNISARIRVELKKHGMTKNQKSLDYCGCTVAFLIDYLATQFTSGMAWDNYGEWHIDHIRPCASFDLTDPEQQKQCFHYTNLQPLWAEDNLRKSDKWDGN